MSIRSRRRALVVLAGAWCVAVCGGSARLVGSELVAQAALLPSVERRLGVEVRAPWVVAGGDTHEVIAFTAVDPNGAAGRAGIVDGDIVVSDASIGDLCRRLTGPPGTAVVVIVVPGGAGPPVAVRPARPVVIVPP